jgi:hypothetical protein
MQKTTLAARGYMQALCFKAMLSPEKKVPDKLTIKTQEITQIVASKDKARSMRVVAAVCSLRSTINTPHVGCTEVTDSECVCPLK